MRALLAAAALGACLMARPAWGQYRVPDALPPLPVGAATCNEKRTHCLVNFADLMTDQLAIQLAGERLAVQAREIGQLRSEIEALRKSKRCAVLTPQRNTAIHHSRASP
jgi:hypothetical protein